MKTIVIQLDAHDDLISVRDKMVWSKAQRILLVWPEDGHPTLERKFDLVSLQRHAVSLGAQLGLVTREPTVRANARELGVAVFRSTKHAQRQNWQRTRIRRRFHRRNQNVVRLKELKELAGHQNPPLFLLGWSRLVIFALGVLAVLVMGVFLLPGATVKIQPVQKEQSLSMVLTADTNLTSPSLSGVVPAEKVSTVVEVQGQVQSSGKTSVADLKASGVVVFTNLTERSLVLPAGSVVSTLAPVQRFATVHAISLPAGVGQTAEVAVTALTGGAAGNISAESVKTLEGALGSDVSVTNQEPFNGGSDQSLPAVSQNDYNRLRKQLLETMQGNAQTDLQASLGSEKSLLAGTLTMGQLIEETATPAVGEPGDVLTLSIRAEFTAYAVSNRDVQQLARAALDAGLAGDQRAIESSLQIEPDSQTIESQDGRFEWKATVSRMTIADLSQESLLKAVLGKRPDVASRDLAKILDLESPPQIELTPSWWFWMPSLSFRIQFEVQ